MRDYPFRKVAVLGANGFIGSRLCFGLAEQGTEVIALVDKNFNYSHLQGRNGITCLEFSLQELECLYDHELLKDVDFLYHMAWAGVNADFRNDAEVQAQNIIYGLKVMVFAEHQGIKRVLVPGSAAEVSCGNGIITGNETAAPSDLYSASKVATRYLCQTFAQKNKIDLIWTLITSIYGPGRDDNNLISYAIKTLLKGGKPSFTGLEQEWDYLYVDDLIQALIVLGKKGIGGKVYPIGSGEHQKMKDYVTTIRDQINPSLPLGIGDLPYKNPDKIDNQVLDISELINDTGYKPTVDFRTGIETVISYFKS